MAKRIKKLEGGDVVLMSDGTEQHLIVGESYDDDFILHHNSNDDVFDPATKTLKADFFAKAVKVISRSSYSKR